MAVALGAHFYTAWRQRKLEDRQDAAEIAGISMLLRGVLDDAEDNAILFSQGCRTISLWGKDYTLSRPFAAVRAIHKNALDKNQSDILLRSDQFLLAERIDDLIRRVNLANLGIEDYSRMRIEFSPVIEKYIGVSIKDVIQEDSQEADSLRKKFHTVSKAAEVFVEATPLLLKRAFEISEEFNRFCSGRALLSKYRVRTESAAKVLENIGSRGERDAPIPSSNSEKQKGR